MSLVFAPKLSIFDMFTEWSNGLYSIVLGAQLITGTRMNTLHIERYFLYTTIMATMPVWHFQYLVVHVSHIDNIVVIWRGWVLLNAFVFSVPRRTGSVWVWICEIVQGKQEKEIRREPRVDMWGWYSMDCHKPYILRAVWHIGRHSWRIARIWWWIHSWPSSSWDRSYPSGIAISVTSFIRFLIRISCFGRWRFI